MNRKMGYPFFKCLLLGFLQFNGLFANEEAIDPEVLQFIEKIQSNQKGYGEECSKCRTDLIFVEESKDDNESHLLVFISFSAPEETWKSYSPILEKTNGSFLLRGAPDNSFQKLAEKIKDLREKGIQASIQIDPESFEKHNITTIPTILLAKGEVYDQITGNISLNEALRIFSESGDLANEARSLLTKLSNQDGMMKETIVKAIEW